MENIMPADTLDHIDLDSENETSQVSSISIPDSFYQSDSAGKVTAEKIKSDHDFEVLIHDSISVKNLEITNETEIRKLLTIANHFKASDVLLVSGQPVLIRRYGRLFALTHTNLKGIELNNYLSTINGAEALSSIRRGIGLNFAYSCSLYDPLISQSTGGFITESTSNGNTNIVAVDRNKVVFRCNVSGCMDLTGNTSFQIVMRLIPSEPPKYSDIGLEESFVVKCIPRIGILYMAGETGSGKSTTLASVLRYTLEEETHIQGNILTLEEPIEFRYSAIKSKHSIIVQSQIPEHFSSFALAVREAMRRKPALLLVQELRDQESFSAAIELSQTGHPVLSTVHSNNVVAILQRVLELVPKDQHSRKLTETISTAHGFIAQRLIATVDGKQMAVREFLFFTKTFRNKLLDEAISERGYGGVIKEIRIVMDNPNGTSFSSPTFEVQAEKLLADGKITQAGYEALLA